LGRYHVLQIFNLSVNLGATVRPWIEHRVISRDTTPARAKPRPSAFLLIPNFTMMAFTSALEPLRLANHITGKRLYDWS
jgi:hypothetical protein